MRGRQVRRMDALVEAFALILILSIVLGGLVGEQAAGGSIAAGLLVLGFAWVTQ